MLGQLLREPQLLLDPEIPPPPEGVEPDSSRAKRHVQDWVVETCAALLDTSGKVVNLRKLTDDLLNRERKASTVIGGGVAFPHVRTMQARDLAAAAIVSRPGLALDAPDGEPVHLILCVVAPPYDDQTYVKLYKRLGQALQSEHLIERLRAVEAAGEVVRILGTL